MLLFNLSFYWTNMALLHGCHNEPCMQLYVFVSFMESTCTSSCRLQIKDFCCFFKVETPQKQHLFVSEHICILLGSACSTSPATLVHFWTKAKKTYYQSISPFISQSHNNNLLTNLHHSLSPQTHTQKDRKKRRKRRSGRRRDLVFCSNVSVISHSICLVFFCALQCKRV